MTRSPAPSRAPLRWLAALTSLSLALAWAGTRPASASADDAKVTGDLKKIQGTWVRDGDEGPESRWSFEGSTLKATVNGMEFVCGVTLDEKASPNKTADFAVKEGGDSAGKTAKGIYKFDGDKLVLCVSHPGGERPSEFKTVEDQQTFLFNLKKE